MKIEIEMAAVMETRIKVIVKIVIGIGIETEIG